MSRRASSPIPMPVSRMSMCRCSSPSAPLAGRHEMRTLPWAVNLTALLTRLVMIWPSRYWSPSMNSGSAGSMSNHRSRPFLRAAGAKACATWPITSRKLKGSRSSCRPPASMREKSRMSLSRKSRVSAEPRRVASWLCCWGVNRLLASRSATPMMPFIGVRISWLMLARKALLARLAPSAASLARSSSWVRLLTSSSRWSRCLASSVSRSAISTSMVLKASASWPISSPEYFCARSLKSLVLATRLAVLVSEPRAVSSERCMRWAMSRASTKAASAAAESTAKSMTTSFHTFFRLAVSATEPIVASFMAMGTMAVTCCQSATWAVPLFSRGCL